MYSRNMLILILWTSVISQVWPQIINPGACPPRSVKSDFEITKYLGTWYQYASFGTELFQGIGKCVTAQYSLSDVPNTIKVHNSQIKLDTNSPNTIDGTAILEKSDKKEGKLLVTFKFKVLGQNISVTSPYWVLDTDYTSYAIIYSCNDVRALHFTVGWILTREQDLSKTPTGEDVLARINNSLVKAKLNPSLYKKTIQEGCYKEWINY